jgi:putative membrane protein
MRAPSLLELVAGHWQAAPGLDAQALLCGGVYLWAIRRLRRPWPAVRTLSFLGGIACVVVALQSGLDAYDDRLLSVHMVQHLLLLQLAPLLLLGGRPTLLLLRAIPPPRRPRAARALARVRPLTGPLPCLLVFTLVVVLSHLPSFYDATLSSDALHELEHVAYLGAGLLVWWPILDADPVGSQRLGGLGKLVYMLVAMVPMAVIGAYLNRHSSLVYAAYAEIADQYRAGAVMWVAGNCVMIAVGLWCSVAALLAEERRQRLRDARLSSSPAPGEPTAAPQLSDRRAT